MATYYVDSAAAGSNNGTSWANAWTSIASAASGAAAGDTVLIDDGHAQSQSSALTLAFAGTFGNPVRLICADKADGSPSAGATVQVTGTGILTISGSIFASGLTLLGSQSTALCSTSPHRQEYHGCTIGISASVSATTRPLILGPASATDAASRVILRNCTIDLATNGNSNGQIRLRQGRISIEESTISAHATATAIFQNLERTPTLDVVACDLSGSGIATLFDHAGRATNVAFRRCRLPSGHTPDTGTLLAGAWEFLLLSCAEGTLSAPPLDITYSRTIFGTVRSSLSRYRTGGADDGAQANPHSWEMISSAEVVEGLFPLLSPPIVRWVQGGSSVTFTGRVASGLTLQDDELWLQLLGPGSGTATAQGERRTTRLALLGTPADLAADTSSTWNGSGVGTKQLVTTTYTPAISGPVELRFALARPSATVYVDPYLGVS